MSVATALDAVTDAAHELAAVVQAAKAALAAQPTTSAPDEPPVVGAEISVDDAYALPVGASFEDSEGDTWFKSPGGFSFFDGAENDWPSYDDTTLSPASYLPLTLKSLPEPAPVAEPEEPTYTPKPGDWVVIKGVYYTSVWASRVGTEAIVAQATMPLPDGVVAYVNTHDDCGIYCTAIEPATAAPVAEPEIQVGDKVRVIEDFYDWRTHIVGKEGVVTAVNKPDFQGTVPFVVSIDDGTETRYAKAVEKIEEPPAIKVGDTVRITDVGDYGCEDELVGLTGTVRSVPGDDENYEAAFRVFVPDWEGGCVAYCTAVEPVTEPGAEPLAAWERDLLAAVAEPEGTPLSEIKVGDRIRVLRVNNLSAGHPHEGKEGTVVHHLGDYLSVNIDGQTWNPWGVKVAEKLEPEPAPTHLSIRGDNGREVHVRPSYATTGARIEVTPGSVPGLHLSAEQTRQLGQTLIAIADQG